MCKLGPALQGHTYSDVSMCVYVCVGQKECVPLHVCACVCACVCV